jgi:SAM-dependent methyltransferase
MALAMRALSAATIEPLYRLGEHAALLKGAPRVRRPIFRALERLSRGNASAARQAFERASASPAYLDASRIEQLIQRYANRRTRSDRRLPHEKAARRADEVLRVLRPFIPATRPKVLDIACGDGLVAAALQRRGADVLAIDLTPERLAATSVPFQCTDAAAMTLDGNQFDAAYSFDAFEHFARPARVLDEAHRVLKPGGVLYASFGPLYYSPFGAHQWLSIGVPYCQLLFRESDVNAVATHLGKRRLTKNLNYWRLSQFRELLDAQADRFDTIARFEKFNVSFVSLVAEYPRCFRSKAADFDELIVRSIEFVFRKRG